MTSKQSDAPPPHTKAKTSSQPKSAQEDGREFPSEQGDDLDARLNEPYGPGQYRSGIESPEQPSKKNPGHTNPAHNTPGHERGDKPQQARQSTAGGEHASYPGIEGEETRRMKRQSKPPVEPASEKHPETIHPKKRELDSGS